MKKNRGKKYNKGLPAAKSIVYLGPWAFKPESVRLKTMNPTRANGFENSIDKLASVPIIPIALYLLCLDRRWRKWRWREILVRRNLAGVVSEEQMNATLSRETTLRNYERNKEGRGNFLFLFSFQYILQFEN